MPGSALSLQYRVCTLKGFAGWQWLNISLLSNDLVKAPCCNQTKGQSNQIPAIVGPIFFLSSIQYTSGFKSIASIESHFWIF